MVLTTWIVLVPWILISMPGKYVGIVTQTGYVNACFEHGWPFVFLERLTCEPNVVINARLRQVGISSGNLKRLAERMGASRIDTINDGLDFDLKTGQPETASFWSTGNNSGDFFQTGFWTNTRRWPFTGDADEEVLRIRWLGILLSLGTLVVVWLFVAWLIELRLLRRGSHLKLSMFEVLTVMSMFAVLLATLRNEYQRSTVENQSVEVLLDGFRNDIQIDGQRQISLPAPVSQLLDHRSRLPFTDVHLFRPVERLFVNISSQKAMAKYRDKRNQFVETMNQSPFPIHLSMEVHLITPEIMQQLTASEAIVEAQIFYVLYCDWKELTESGSKLPVFKFGFPNVKRLGVGLSRNVPQKNQIEPLLALPKLEELHIWDVDVEGAEYLNSVRDKLPNQTTADLCSDLDPDNFSEFTAAFSELVER